jgi:hypothetical protein
MKAGPIDFDFFLPQFLRVLERLVETFDATFEVLEWAESLVPAPTLEEAGEMRQGKRPLTREAYLIGLLQRCALGAENLASDLRIDQETLRRVHELDSSQMELDAMVAAVARRHDP